MVHSSAVFLQVIGGDIDGIIHRHPLLLRGVAVSSGGSYRSRVTCNRLLYQVMRLSQRAVYTYGITSYTFLLRQKKNCDIFLWVILCSTINRFILRYQGKKNEVYTGTSLARGFRPNGFSPDDRWWILVRFI